MRAIEELDYRRNAIARSLKVNRTKTLGVVIPDIANEFYCEIVRGAEDAARSEHYNIILCSTDSRPVQEINTITMLAEKQVDGVIMLSYDCCLQTLDALKHSGLPTALISTLCTDDAFITINISNFDAAYQAVEHLISLGHRSIAMLAGRQATLMVVKIVCLVTAPRWQPTAFTGWTPLKLWWCPAMPTPMRRGMPVPGSFWPHSACSPLYLPQQTIWP